MEKIAENVYVETGYEGVNVGAIITRQGTIAIDVPSYPRQARDWALRLQSFTLKPILYLILTDYNGDRILNSRWLNAPIITHQITANKLLSYDKRFPNPLSESLTMRNPQRAREFNNNLVQKPAISFSKKMQILKGQEKIQLLKATGPTSSNIWAYLPNKGVLFAGDTVVVGQHPRLLEPTSKQWLESLAKLRNWPLTIQQLVPGRGSLSTSGMIEPVAHYFSVIRSCLQTHISNGRQREETAVYIPQFMAMFPQQNLPEPWLHQQIKRTLDHVYDEIQLEQNPISRSESIFNNMSSTARNS